MTEYVLKLLLVAGVAGLLIKLSLAYYFKLKLRFLNRIVEEPPAMESRTISNTLDSKI